MTALQQISQSQAQKELIANENFSSTAIAALFSNAPATTSALTWGYYGGVILYNGVLTNIADATITLTDNTTNYVEVTRAGVVSSNTTGFTAGRVPLHTVITNSGVISSFVDERVPSIDTSGAISINVAGNSDVTLSYTQSQCQFITLTGALTGNIHIIIPATPRWYAINNQTSGSFTVTFKTASGAGIVVNQSAQTFIYCDGTDTFNITSSSSITIPVPLSEGGTNANLTADNGGIVYCTSTGFAILAHTTTGGQMLRSGSSTTPTWSTATWPSTITVNGILYGSSSNVVGQITTANNGVFVTDGSGVPTIGATLPSAVQGNITSVGTVASGVWNATNISEPYGGTNQSTYTLGDILYSSASNTLSKLAGNTTSTKKFLRQTGTGAVSAAPAWDTILAADVPGSALTKTDDTNVTMTLGGSPTTALLNAASMTLGWTGQLSETRGGTNQSSYTQGDILYSSASNTLSKLAKSSTATRYLANTGTSNNPAWDQVNLSNGVTGILPNANGGSGVSSSKTIIQRVNTTTGSLATGTTIIPADNTIPQNTEGDQYMSLSITPTNSSNKLFIEVIANVGTSIASNGLMIMALFQDSTANALAVCAATVPVSGTGNCIPMKYEMVAGTTSATTFKIRIGGNSAGTTTLNGFSGTAYFGGTFVSSMTITEITV